MGGKSQLYQNIIIGTIPWRLGSSDPTGLQIADVCWLKTCAVSLTNTNSMFKGFYLPLPPSALINTLNASLKIVRKLLKLLTSHLKAAISDQNNTKSSANSFLVMVPTLCDIIITACTSIAHAAGALGKKTIVLSCGSDYFTWCDTKNKGKSTWYKNVWCIRQATGKWDQSLIDAKDILEEIL
jgi:hypothetical protein